MGEEPNVVIINFGSSKTPAIQEMLEGIGISSEMVDWKNFSSQNLIHKKAIILSGAPVLLTKTNPAPYLEKFNFLKEIPLPVLGICFGHQLLGMLYGAHVFLGEEVRKSQPITITKSDSLFSGFEKEVSFTEDHTEGIELPDDFHLLASSGQYPVEAMKHNSKALYGVQFHPEVSGEEGRKLMRNFMRLSGKT